MKVSMVIVGIASYQTLLAVFQMWHYRKYEDKSDFVANDSNHQMFRLQMPGHDSSTENF